MGDLASGAPANAGFRFGTNWRSFLGTLDDEGIVRAERALADMLGVGDLGGRSFLDIGSGSGLSSLLARRLGARVHSFDHDPESVACTAALRERYFAGDAAWTIARGSVLDPAFMGHLGQFDVVYACGVLHHTQDRWRAMEHAVRSVAPGGILFIAIYADQGWISSYWRLVKRLYNVGALPRVLILRPTLLIFRRVVGGRTRRVDVSDPGEACPSGTTCWIGSVDGPSSAPRRNLWSPSMKRGDSPCCGKNRGDATAATSSC